MMQILATFAAFSMISTILLTLLPEGSIKRTAGMAIGLLTLLCWAEGVAGLLHLDWPDTIVGTPLVSTSVSLDDALQEATAFLARPQEATP